MDHKSVQQWLDKYVEAWKSYNPAQIGDLFSENALYFYSPWDEDNPIRGREAIVAEWRREPDPSGSWEARYEPIVVEGEVAVAQGRTRYIKPDGSIDRQFNNIFVLNFDKSGRCERFTEWYMQPRSAQQAAT